MLIHYPWSSSKTLLLLHDFRAVWFNTPPSSYCTQGTGAELSVGLLDVAGQQWVIAQFKRLFSDSPEHQLGQRGAAAWNGRCADNVPESLFLKLQNIRSVLWPVCRRGYLMHGCLHPSLFLRKLRSSSSLLPSDRWSPLSDIVSTFLHNMKHLEVTAALNYCYINKTTWSALM